MKYEFMHNLTRHTIDIIGDIDTRIFYAVTDPTGHVINRKTTIKAGVLNNPESRYFSAKLADGATVRIYLKDVPGYAEGVHHAS